MVAIFSDAFIRDIVRRFKPRKIIWGKYKYLAQVFDYAGDVYYGKYGWGIEGIN